MTDHRRASDRWMTPAVACTFLLVAGGLVALLIAVVGYLTVRGYNPAPILDLVAKLVTAVGALGTLILQLIHRATVTKVERNTGEMAREVKDVADAIYAPEVPAQDTGLAASPRTFVAGHGPLPPVPPARC